MSSNDINFKKYLLTLCVLILVIMMKVECQTRPSYNETEIYPNANGDNTHLIDDKSETVLSPWERLITKILILLMVCLMLLCALVTICILFCRRRHHIITRRTKPGGNRWYGRGRLLTIFTGIKGRNQEEEEKKEESVYDNIFIGDNERPMSFIGNLQPPQDMDDRTETIEMISFRSHV